MNYHGLTGHVQKTAEKQAFSPFSQVMTCADAKKGDLGASF
jgi:hypothetical protein